MKKSTSRKFLMYHAITDGSETDPTSTWNTIRRRVTKFGEVAFEFSKRDSTFQAECMCGVVQFLSTMYCLPVIPSQMAQAGYWKRNTIVSIAFTCCVGNILLSWVSNLPFIVAPPTSVSIYLVAAQLSLKMDRDESNTVVMLSGLILLIIGIFRFIGRFIASLIPDCIQASTAVGIGLITAFAGAIDLKLIVRGEYTILSMGSLTADVFYAALATVAIGIALHYHIKQSFVIGLVTGTLLQWIFDHGWPPGVIQMPDYEFNVYAKEVTWDMMHLVFNLVFLYILLLSGLARSLSDLAQLSKPDGSIPRGNWIFIVCGIMTIASGYLCGPPILISPETAAGIKSGARTGLSTMICGLLYALSIFFSPLLAGVPASGTSPLMFFVGLLLFQNIGRINFHDQLNGIPAFFVLLLIPFTYSIMCGVGSGYFLYVSMSLLTGKMYFDVKNFVLGYWNSWGGTHCPCSVDSSPRMYEEEVILRTMSMDRFERETAQTLLYDPDMDPADIIAAQEEERKLANAKSRVGRSLSYLPELERNIMVQVPDDDAAETSPGKGNIMDNIKGMLCLRTPNDDENLDSILYTNDSPRGVYSPTAEYKSYRSSMPSIPTGSLGAGGGVGGGATAAAADDFGQFGEFGEATPTIDPRLSPYNSSKHSPVPKNHFGFDSELSVASGSKKAESATYATINSPRLSAAPTPQLSRHQSPRPPADGDWYSFKQYKDAQLKDAAAVGPTLKKSKCAPGWGNWTGFEKLPPLPDYLTKKKPQLEEGSGLDSDSIDIEASLKLADMRRRSRPGGSLLLSGGTGSTRGVLGVIAGGSREDLSNRPMDISYLESRTESYMRSDGALGIEMNQIRTDKNRYRPSPLGERKLAGTGIAGTGMLYEGVDSQKSTHESIDSQKSEFRDLRSNYFVSGRHKSEPMKEGSHLLEGMPRSCTYDASGAQESGSGPGLRRTLSYTRGEQNMLTLRPKSRKKAKSILDMLGDMDMNSQISSLCI